MDINTAIRAQLLEDNGGGLHYVLSDGRSCSMAGVYKGHSQAGQMLADIAAVEDWIDDTRKDRPDEADTVGWNEEGMIVIAERDGGTITLHLDGVGASGAAYLGVA